MSLARALALFFGLLTIDAIAAFVLLVLAGIIAPRGLGASLSVILGALLLAIFIVFAVSATIYIRMLSAASPAVTGRWLLVGSFVLAEIVLYAVTVIMTLVVFNR